MKLQRQAEMTYPSSIFEESNNWTYKSTYQILSDISDIWDELSDKQQAGLTEKLFGKTRANVHACAQKYVQIIYLIAGNALEPCTTIAEKSRYDGYTTQGLAVRASKCPNVIPLSQDS